MFQTTNQINNEGVFGNIKSPSVYGLNPAISHFISWPVNTMAAAGHSCLNDKTRQNNKRVNLLPVYPPSYGTSPVLVGKDRSGPCPITSRSNTTGLPFHQQWSGGFAWQAFRKCSPVIKHGKLGNRTKSMRCPASSIHCGQCIVPNFNSHLDILTS